MSIANRPGFWSRIKQALSIFWGAVRGKPTKMNQLQYVLDMAPQDPRVKTLFNTKKSTTLQFQVVFHRNKKMGNQWG